MGSNNDNSDSPRPLVGIPEIEGLDGTDSFAVAVGESVALGAPLARKVLGDTMTVRTVSATGDVISEPRASDAKATPPVGVAAAPAAGGSARRGLRVVVVGTTLVLVIAIAAMLLR